jgi:hypothetical protein
VTWGTAGSGFESRRTEIVFGSLSHRCRVLRRSRRRCVFVNGTAGVSSRRTLFTVAVTHFRADFAEPHPAQNARRSIRASRSRQRVTANSRLRFTVKSVALATTDLASCWVCCCCCRFVSFFLPAAVAVDVITSPVSLRAAARCSSLRKRRASLRSSTLAKSSTSWPYNAAKPRAWRSDASDDASRPGRIRTAADEGETDGSFPVSESSAVILLTSARSFRRRCRPSSKAAIATTVDRGFNIAASRPCLLAWRRSRRRRASMAAPATTAAA